MQRYHPRWDYAKSGLKVTVGLLETKKREDQQKEDEQNAGYGSGEQRHYTDYA